MKKIMSIMLVAGAMMAFGGETAAPASAPNTAAVNKRIAAQAKSLNMTVEEYKALTPEQLKTKKEELRVERMAKRYGVTVDEVRAMTKEQRAAKEAELREKRHAEQAAKLGITLEEFKKLTPEELRAKRKAARAAKKSAAKKAQD